MSKSMILMGTAAGLIIAAGVVSSATAMFQPGNQRSDRSQERVASRDIVDTAVAAGSFKTLAAALQAAGLVETLKGKGPFTVFAPTDEAFAKLPPGTVETLLKPENKAQLVAVLTYHVVPGTAKAEKVTGMTGAVTVNGQRIAIATSGGKVKVGTATVVQTDIMASNGVIHVIDSVILPEMRNAVQVAEGAGTFNTLLAAAKAAGLVEALQSNPDGKGLTIFAPTDAAFAKLPAGTVESLLKPENKGKLETILKHHVVAGRAFAADVVGTHQTLAGQSLVVKSERSGVTAGGATVVTADIQASNAVIHIVDSVILPQN